METEAQAFWVSGPGAGEIRPVPLRRPGAGEALVRTLRSGVSRGTESLVFRGRLPPSQYDAMRAPFQEGDFPGPVKYGYLSVGVVEQAALVRWNGGGVGHRWVSGRRRAGWGIGAARGDDRAPNLAFA